jgi:hypothetical protein
MLREPHRVHVNPDSELGHLLDELGEMPVLLEKDGKVYRVTIEENNGEDAGSPSYDAEQVKAAVRKTSGSWADIDADKFLADLYHARHVGSRRANRP